MPEIAAAKMKVRQNIRAFLSDRKPYGRYASFDYCFNYFHSFYERDRLRELASKDNIQKSCLQLGFYLASWGMYRGSSFLLRDCSVKHYEPLLKAIAKPKMECLWEIDVDKYTQDNIKRLLAAKDVIKKKLGRKNNPSDTLVTKIMLGVFGNTPAFDTYFRSGMKLATFNKKSLDKISGFYLRRKKDFDFFGIPTIDFLTGKNTKLHYTKAKLVDMAAFQEGWNKESV